MIMMIIIIMYNWYDIDFIFAGQFHKSKRALQQLAVEAALSPIEEDDEQLRQLKLEEVSLGDLDMTKPNKGTHQTNFG